jgi:hypothetical protein
MQQELFVERESHDLMGFAFDISAVWILMLPLVSI